VDIKQWAEISGQSTVGSQQYSVNSGHGTVDSKLQWIVAADG
jgi:hypothetical protein